MTRRWMTLAVLLALAGCGRVNEEEAKGAVKGYLDKLIEAYATSNEEVVDPLVTERQGRKILGLIGVKADSGMAMEARVLELAWERFAKDGDAVVVETREQWAYRDVDTTSRQQVGEASTDAYAVRYRLVRQDGKLKVDEVEFREKPVVGRKVAPMAIDTRAAHGIPPAEAGGEAAGPDRPAPPGAPPPEGAGPPPGHPPMTGTPPPGHPPIPPGSGR